MDKHRSRLKQEKGNLTRRINQIQKELAALDKVIAIMGKDVKGAISSMSPSTIITSIKETETIKRMPLKY